MIANAVLASLQCALIGPSDLAIVVEQQLNSHFVSAVDM
jgi:hypothetical protein